MSKKRFKFPFTTSWRLRTTGKLTTPQLKRFVTIKKRVEIQSARKIKRSIDIFGRIKQKFIVMKVQSHPFVQIGVFWLKNLLLAGVVLTIFGIFARWLLDPHTLPISVHIVGNQQVTTVELEKVVAPYLTGGFFHINLSAIERAILTIPWVKQATVQRQFPDILWIAVQERHAAALWHDNAIVDTDGDLFSGVNLASLLPLFTAPITVTAKAVLTNYQQLQPLLHAKNLKIQQFGCNVRQAWFMILENNIHLLLGRGDIRTRLQRFIKVYDRFQSSLFSLCTKQGLANPALCISQEHKNFIVHIDLRYTNGMAVRLVKAE